MAVDSAQNHFLVLATNGAGITTALDIFSDFGFLAVAGVDPQQIHNIVMPLTQGVSPVAFALRLTPDVEPVAIVSAIQALKQNLPNLKILTLDAPEEVLVQRYLDSDKKHPFESPALAGLQAAVAAEKKIFAPLKELKDYSIDTSTTTPVELRNKIAKVLGIPVNNQEFTVYITTFGFKYGIPQDAEMMFDMRFMTNPFYDEALRPMTGQDKPVRDFIFALAHARNFFSQWSTLITDMLPQYQAEGKTRLTIAVGCTGGKHRSVCMAEELARHLRTHCPGFNVVISHREMLRWGKPAASAIEAGEGKPESSACTVGENT
ncbi:MAG TPA: RNase adapter RapZ [Coleofasciculaceae cyanobacterium]|jgi:UPF0042 nucleotide-binding protein